MLSPSYVENGILSLYATTRLCELRFPKGDNYTASLTDLMLSQALIGFIADDNIWIMFNVFKVYGSLFLFILLSNTLIIFNNQRRFWKQLDLPSELKNWQHLNEPIWSSQVYLTYLKIHEQALWMINRDGQNY